MAYFDLLGTSDLSRFEPLAYSTSLAQFRSHVVNSSKELAGSVYFFSDCAFVEADDVASIVAYMQEVRGALFDGGYFITAAIGPGGLIPQRTSKGRATGTYFEGNVVDVYGLQSNLKGIGVRVHPALVDEVRNLGQAVNTCHLPLTGGRQAECFVDLKYSVAPREKYFQQFLRTFFKIHTRARRLGRYYVSAVISWINSSSFADVALPTEDGAKRSLILDVLLNGTFERNFGDLVGLEYIYFALLDKLYSEDVRPELQDMAAKYVAQRKSKLVARMEHVPTPILSRDSYSRFIDYLSRRTGFLPPRRPKKASAVT